MHVLARFTRFSWLLSAGMAVVVAAVVAAQQPAPSSQHPAPSSQQPAPSSQHPAASSHPPTFSKDVAPIVFTHCAECHSPGGVAPFSVLTYSAVRQHASQIASVTRAGLMPPWRAHTDYGPFLDQHPLSAAEIDRIAAWVKAGAPEGDPRDLPPAPHLTAGWELGTPDLVLTLPDYTLQGDGTDVFHIFVVSVPIDRERFVRGLEFHPGNSRVVHHANIRIDPTPASRALDDEDPGPGYEGVIAHTAAYPDGHFLGWTPGQVAPLLPKGLAWRLEPHSDLVVEIHMQPDGKVEHLQPSIALFFGSDPPERTPMMLRLGRQDIDIPAGDKAYVETDSFTLPVDAEVEALQPHAHQRAKEITGTATLPDGTTHTLIHIADWDFRWQHVYRFQTPFTLPKGSTIAMRYVYDNSADNPRNPVVPPQRVLWGQRSRDEMGDLWVQVLTKTQKDYDRLAAAFGPKVVGQDVLGYEREISRTPDSIALHDSVALLYLQLNRPLDAARHFEASAKLQPASPPAHFNLGTALAIAGQADRAIAEYRRALELRPDYAQAHNNLAGMLLQSGRTNDAIQQYQDAVRIDPKYTEAYGNLARAYAVAGDWREAAAAVGAALKLSPPEPLASALRAQLSEYRARE